MWTETKQALKAMKEHGVDKHLVWISKLWDQHSLQFWLGHFRVKKIQKQQRASTRSARKPHGVHIAGGHGARSTEQKIVEKSKEFGFRLDECHLPSVANADDIVVLAMSQKALEQLILDLHRRVQRNWARAGPVCFSSTNMLQDPWLQAGGRKRGMDGKPDTEAKYDVESTRVDTKKRTRDTEQVRDGAKQRKRKTATQVGRPHGMGRPRGRGRHRHSGIKGPQNKRSQMVETSTNKTQMNMETGYTPKDSHAGDGKHRLQCSKEYKDGK